VRQRGGCPCATPFLSIIVFTSVVVFTPTLNGCLIAKWAQTRSWASLATSGLMRSISLPVALIIASSRPCARD